MSFNSNLQSQKKNKAMSSKLWKEMISDLEVLTQTVT